MWGISTNTWRRCAGRPRSRKMLAQLSSSTTSRSSMAPPIGCACWRTGMRTNITRSTSARRPLRAISGSRTNARKRGVCRFLAKASKDDFVKEASMPQFTRRSAIAGLVAFIAAPARAETPWPSRPITLLHGYAAGGPTDTIARLVADGLSKRLGQQVIVDAKPGAAGTIAAAQVGKAGPDGYTLMVMPGGHATAAALYKKLPFRAVEDFSMISMVADYPFVFVTYPDHAIISTGDLIALARTRDVPLLYGTPGIGSVHHLSVELF